MTDRGGFVKGHHNGKIPPQGGKEPPSSKANDDLRLANQGSARYKETPPVTGR